MLKPTRFFHFFVPAGVPEVAIDARDIDPAYRQGLRLSGDGLTTTTIDVPKSGILRLPSPGAAGVWTLTPFTAGGRGVVLLNIPHRVAYRREALLVAKDWLSP